MSQQIQQIETFMQSLINEHKKLLMLVEAHQKAIRALDLKAMEDAGQAQEACRLRIATIETKRRTLALQLMRATRIHGEPTVSKLAEMFPQRREMLLKLRNELRALVEQISSKTHVGAKVAGAVLGHLNTVVRLIAGAVEQAGVYTRQGIPASPGRLGVMEAVG
jgi:hypothetical protein